jgi:hypothetical protein
MDDKKAEQGQQGENYWDFLHRTMAEERRQKELARYGEQVYADRQKAIDAAIDVVVGWIIPLMDEARKLGCGFFRCDLHHALRSTSLGECIRIQFADGRGKYFERCPSLDKTMNRFLTHPSGPEYWDVVSAVHRYVRERGFGPLSSRMLQQRVKLDKKLYRLS